MTAFDLLLLLTVHFVADFVLQSDWMAQNKSKRVDALFLHAAVYSGCFLFYGPAFVALTFLLHFTQDAITSRLNSWLYPRIRSMPSGSPAISPAG